MQEKQCIQSIGMIIGWTDSEAVLCHLPLVGRIFRVKKPGEEGFRHTPTAVPLDETD